MPANPSAYIEQVDWIVCVQEEEWPDGRVDLTCASHYNGRVVIRELLQIGQHLNQILRSKHQHQAQRSHSCVPVVEIVAGAEQLVFLLQIQIVSFFILQCTARA